MASASEMLDEIAARLVLLRTAHNQPNQAAFARWVGITPQTLNNYEGAYSRLSLDAAMKITRRTRVTLDWLYFGETGGLPYDVFERLTAAENSQNQPPARSAS